MKLLTLLLVLFLGMGLLVRKYDTWVRVILIGAILLLVLYSTFL